MLKLVLGDEHLRVRFEAGYDGGRNEGSGAGPSLRRMGVPFEVSAGLEEEGQGCNHLGKAEGVGEKIGDEIGERVDRFSNNTFHHCDRWRGRQEGCTFLDRPRMFRFGEKTPVEPEFGIDLVSRVERARTPEPFI